MSDRLPTHMLVGALIRRVHQAGGAAAVLARGDKDGGTILVLALERGRDPRFFERGLGPTGDTALIETGPRGGDDEAVDFYWRKRRSNDPDLWVIEVDIARAERFAAETILQG